MNNYELKDIYVGLSHSFEAEITKQYMEQFLNITGDNNPMHADAEFARLRGMKSTVVYGMLTASFYSTLVGVHLPGRNALLHSVDAQFSKPVFIGDRLSISGKVVNIHEVFQQIEIKATITNQDGVKVSRAKIKAGILHG